MFRAGVRADLNRRRLAGISIFFDQPPQAIDLALEATRLMRWHRGTDVPESGLPLENEDNCLDAWAILLAGGGTPPFMIGSVDDATFEVTSAD